jgi:hypothetical protein
MSVGDIASDAKGTGARFNDGKPDFSLIPLHVIAEAAEDANLSTDQELIRRSLANLGMFQITCDREHLRDALSNASDSWRDCARVFEYGKKKYAEWNWAKGMAWSVPIACAGRHALAYLEGEALDQESGLDHRGHFLCNLVMLYTFIDAFPQGNDLPDPKLFAPF